MFGYPTDPFKALYIYNPWYDSQDIRRSLSAAMLAIAFLAMVTVPSSRPCAGNARKRSPRRIEVVSGGDYILLPCVTQSLTSAFALLALLPTRPEQINQFIEPTEFRQSTEWRFIMLKNIIALVIAAAFGSAAFAQAPAATPAKPAESAKPAVTAPAPAAVTPAPAAAPEAKPAVKVEEKKVKGKHKAAHKAAATPAPAAIPATPATAAPAATK